jgi:hypothetical protein
MKIHSIKLPSDEIISIGDEICYVSHVDSKLYTGKVQSFIWNEDIGDHFYVEESINEYPIHSIVGSKAAIKKMLE